MACTAIKWSTPSRMRVASSDIARIVGGAASILQRVRSVLETPRYLLIETPHGVRDREKKMDHGLDGQMLMAEKPTAFVTEIVHPDAFVSQIEMLEMEIEGLTTELVEEKERTKEKQIVCEKHAKDLRSLALELSDCRNKLDTCLREIELARADVKQKNNVLETTQKELLQSKQLLEQSTEEKQKSEQTQARVSGQSEQTVEELLAIIEEREKELAESKRHNKNLNKLHEDYKTSSANQMAEFDQEYREQQADLMIKLERSEKEMRNFRATSAKDKREINELRRHIQSINKDKGGRDDEMKSLENHLTSRDIKIDKLSRDLEALQIKAKKVPSLARQVARMEADVVNWNSHTKKLTEETEAMKSTFDQEMKIATRTINELQASNANLRDKNADSIRQITTLRSGREEDKKEYMKTLSAIESEWHEKFSDREQNHGNKLAESEAKCAALVAEGDAYKTAISRFEKERQQASYLISELNNKKKRLERQLNKAERGTEEGLETIKRKSVGSFGS